MNDVRHCSDCGEDHAGHHDRTEMTRNGGGLYVRPCDPSRSGGQTFGSAGGRVTSADRRAAEAAYRGHRLYHDEVCMRNGAGYIDPRDLTADTARPHQGSARGLPSTT